MKFTMKEVKDYLNSIINCEDHIRSLMNERQALLSSLQRISKWNDMKVQSTPTETTEDRQIAAIEYANEIARKTHQQMERKISISRTIREIKDERYQEILIQRYLYGNTWEQIAQIMRYDVRHIHRMHGKALIEFKDVMECHT